MTNKNRILLFILFTISFLFQGCSTIYYVGETTEPTNIYLNQDSNSNIIYNAPVGTKLLIKKKYKNYYYVVYDNYEGYSRNTVFNNYRKFNSKVDGILYGYSTNKLSTTTSSKSIYSTNSGGSVQVKGYYRKNGTYVRPHTRSFPKRR